MLVQDICVHPLTVEAGALRRNTIGIISSSTTCANMAALHQRPHNRLCGLTPDEEFGIRDIGQPELIAFPG